MPVDPVRAMPDCHDLAIRAEHDVGIEMRLDLFVIVIGDFLTKLGPGFLIKEEDCTSSVVISLTSKVEQAFDDNRRDPRC
jgi:hypothetical protein